MIKVKIETSLNNWMMLYTDQQKKWFCQKKKKNDVIHIINT